MDDSNLAIAGRADARLVVPDEELEDSSKEDVSAVVARRAGEDVPLETPPAPFGLNAYGGL